MSVANMLQHLAWCVRSWHRLHSTIAGHNVRQKRYDEAELLELHSQFGGRNTAVTLAARLRAFSAEAHVAFHCRTVHGAACFR